MKKTLFIIACFLSTFSFAQLPANSLGQDFTITDIEGETHNLYDILDEGLHEFLTNFIKDISAVYLDLEKKYFLGS